MSDSEDEDYMSDKILTECAQQDVRPGLLFRSSQKRALEIYKKEQELREQPKPKLQEQERRDEGLNTALSPENRGFKMLEKMGYTPGTGLGKSYAGITEPVSIALKSNSSGLGRDQHVKDIKKRKIEIKEKHIEACENQFVARRTEKLLASQLKSDIYKAQRICEDLDKKQGIEIPKDATFWPKSTVKLLIEKNKHKITDYYETSSSSSDSDYDQDNEQDFKDLITYLRSKYKYCMYCGDYIENESECPGYFRTDHD